MHLPVILQVHHLNDNLPSSQMAQQALGKPTSSKTDEFLEKFETDEFLEKFQTAVEPHPPPLEWSLSLEIMCMHFILSGPHTYLHVYKQIWRRQF